MSTLDLLGDEIKAGARKLERREAAALVEVLKALRAHPAVAWAERMNSGATKIGRRFVRFGWPGAPDLIGQLRDGRLLHVEVKAPGGRLRPEQKIMIARVIAAGGAAFVARDLRDVSAHLGPMGQTEAGR